MAVGQAVLSGTWDVAALRAAEDRLEQRSVDAGRVHAALLRDVLVVHDEYCAARMSLSAQPQIALLLRCSEWRAGKLLHDALGLAELPEALAALEWGLLTVEQSSVVVAQLAPLNPPDRLAVWQRLLVRLRADLAQGAVCPPARLGELLKRWVIEADQAAAQERRKQAEDDRSLGYRRREDGLVDIFLNGVRAPDAQAVLQRIRQASAPVSLFDERTADQRRLDAAVDLLLGRSDTGTGIDCPGDCRPGAAPCGAAVQVLVPLGAALGMTDEAAELVGHGPIEADLLQDLLLGAPRLRPVFLGQDGVPVAVGDRVLTPQRGDPAGLRRALLRLALSRPSRLWPRHPADHPPGGGPPGGAPSDPDPVAAPAAPAASSTGDPMPAGGRRHPTGDPGGYRPPRALRRLTQVRAPRCEFPGCGARAVRCDAEHDTAWPAGPTCSCNLGPCCRRHHRVKQQGWLKTRGQSSAVRWTSPSGRSWLSGGQHRPLSPRTRPLLPLPTAPSPWDELSPAQQEHELWELADRPDDPANHELRAVDIQPDEDGDRLVEHILHSDTRWGLDLSNPYSWLDKAAFEAG